MSHVGLLEIGNRAFARLAKALDLPGSIHLGEVDLSAAIPALELRDYVGRELVTQRSMYRVEQFGVGGGSELRSINPREPTDWDSVTIRGREITSGDERAVPDAHDALVIHCGAWASDTDVSNVTILRERAITAPAALTVNTALAYFDTRVGGGAMVDSNNRPFAQNLPWPIYSEQFWELGARLVAADTVDVAVNLVVLSADPGVLPAFPV